MKRNNKYQPPFPYFGGKSAIAHKVWEALGQPSNFVEPFFGSGAVLFLRPSGEGHVETVNDADGLLANFWRALKHEPEAVAEFADNPVNECDLHARHLWLVGKRESITDALCGDESFYDAKAAGYWVWGLSCWIGNGWCSGSGAWIAEDGIMVRANGDAGRGVNRQLPHLGDAGQGVNRKRPHLGNAGQGVDDETANRAQSLRVYLQGLASRLRNVRVCCGDWRRVCGPSVTFKHGVTGIFLDPPYSAEAQRCQNLYAIDCDKVSHDVREWAIEQGENPLMRIVLAGYEGEHAMPAAWRVVEWKAAGGYGSQSENGNGRKNSNREQLWCSPHCQVASHSLLF